MKKPVFLILVVIFLVALFLRLYKIGSVPPSPSLDEVSIGYNAYSILKTGADEYGTKFPVLLRAYDDWRPALYVYLVIPFVNLFGLTVTAVRLPSVILSILAVVATYFLVVKIFSSWKYAIHLGLLSSLLLAINPWQIYLSRLGHEANAGFAFFVFSLFFFFRNNIYLFFIFLALSFVSYQSEKIFLPLFFIALVFLFKDRFLHRKKQVVIGVLIAVIVVFPFFKATLEPNALIRFKATNIIEANHERFQKEALILAENVKENNTLGIIIHNRRLVAAKIVFEGYISHFNPVWLFFNPLADKHKVPGLGLFYLWEAPLFILGFFWLIKSKIDKKIKLLFLSWLFIAPLPGAITTDAPHAMRIYTLLPLPSILAGLGLVQIYLFFQRYKIQKGIFYILFATTVIVSSLYFFYKYFIVFPKTQSSSFQYALSQTIPFVLRQDSIYNEIVFSNIDNLYQSYMFFLFFSKYDPFLYQQQGGTVSGGFAQTHSFDKYEFRPISYVSENEGTLLIGNISDFPIDKNPLRIFADLDKKEVIKIIER